MTAKHKVATDALETLGNIIHETAGRDAIHLAVEPIEAAEAFRPGDSVQISEGKAWHCATGGGVGIVDPFLTVNVMPGQRFWLVVKPRTITSLRHVWSHPAFQENEVVAAPSYGVDEQWLRNFANGVSLHYDVLMEGAAEYVRSKEQGGWGEYLCFGGLLEGEYVPDEFWTHYDAVTGNETPEAHRGSFFSCSC